MAEIKWVRREDSAEIYANFFFVNWSIVDVRIRLGQLIPTDNITAEGRPESVSEEQAAITISWPTIKALNNHLTDIIAKQEKANGPIELEKLKLAD